MDYLLFVLILHALSAGATPSPIRARDACSAPSNYAANTTYVGCFSDTGTRTLVSEAVADGSDVTPQSCADICGSAGYLYSGVEFSRQCFCGNSIGAAAEQLEESACNQTCSGDPSQICGGFYLMNVYQVDNPSADPSPLNIPDCTKDPLCSLPLCDATLSYEARVSWLISNMTVEEKLSNLMFSSPGVPRLGLPRYNWWSEALHGLASSSAVVFEVDGPNTTWSHATSFPMPILIGATFDDNLVLRVAQVIGKETRAFGNNGRSGFDVWSPNINPFRDPRWGRGAETPGEDPFHLSNYVYNMITGLQGGVDPDEVQVIATCKHFAVYDIETARKEIDLDPSPQDLTDYYMPPFKTCARDAKVGAFMCSYNAVDGVPACSNRYMMQTLLREHWGWDQPYQWITSDCDAVNDIWEYHNYTADSITAAAAALNAGTDLACEGSIYNDLVQAISFNMTNEATVDRSISRLYLSLMRLGFFDLKNSKYASLGWTDVDTSDARDLAKEAAVKGMTLMKNDGTLPLPASVASVALIGPYGNATTQMQGSYSGVAPYLVSPLMAMQAKWQNVTYGLGTAINTEDSSNFSSAIELASASDYIIYCGGIDGYIEGEARDRTTISWPGNQLSLVGELSALGKPLVVVQFGGGQLDDSVLLANDSVSAIVWAGYPGQSGGDALVDLLDGTLAFAGRLPITQYPAHYVDETEMVDPQLQPNSTTGNPGKTYKWYSEPVLPFGYGLHYTEFNVSWSKAIPSQFSISEIVTSAGGENGAVDRSPFATVDLDVSNNGGKSAMISDYVALAFLSSTDAGSEPYPLRSLAAYGRLSSIQVGETTTISLTIPISSIARSDVNGHQVIYPGNYTLSVDTDGKIPVSFALTGDAATIDMVPEPPISPVPLAYVGCYSGATNSTAGGTVSQLAENSPQICADYCNASGYKLSGTQDQTECFCKTGITDLTPVSEDNCNLPCSGNPGAICGGNTFINVYNNTPAYIIQPPTFQG